MAALPFLITAATFAYVTVFPEEGRIESSNALSPLSRINSFWGGVGVGISLSLLASYETKRRRLWQRVRLKFFSWLHDTGVTRIGGQRGGTPLLQKYRKPHSILQLDGTPIPRKSETENDDINGTHLELVSPEWVPSSNLYCDVVTVPKGTELLSRKSEGVEFYYVIKGDGMYVDQHGEQHQISAECGFIVDPECNRGFIVAGTANALVLLRATDVAVSGANGTRLQATSLTSTVAVVTAGLNKIYQLIGTKFLK